MLGYILFCRPLRAHSNSEHIIVIQQQLMTETQTFLNQPTSVFHCHINSLPHFEDLIFKPSSYSQWNEGQIYRKFDLQIRDCVQVEIDDSALAEKADDLLTEMMADIDQEYVKTDDKWRFLKYKNGHFTQHCDYYRQRDPLIHFGTQIWLPPKNFCSYEGGVLKTKDKTEQEITPSETEWTFIVLPLGVLHQITQVMGTRISYVKPIYIKAMQQTYDIPRTSNYGEGGGKPLD